MTRSLFQDPAPGSSRRWFMLVFGSLNFVLSMFYRGTVAVMSQSLVAEMGFDASGLSLLSAMFFYSFAVAQIPIGLALDKWGARITTAILSAAAIPGALLFGLGESQESLLVARALLGLGMAGNLMIMLCIIADWFPANRFAFISGMVVSIGVMGNLLAATPLALMNLAWGRRATFLVFTVINLLVVGALLASIRDRPEGTGPQCARTEQLFRGLWELAHNYNYWAISLSSFVRYGYFSALQSLWLAPFVIYGVGLGEIAAANVILSLGLGYMIGLPISGFLSDRVVKSRKKMIVGCLALFGGVALIPLHFGPGSSEFGLWILFGFMGMAAAPGQIMYAHMKELLPPEMTARAMTAVNLFNILGAGFITQILELLVGKDFSGYSTPGAFDPIWYAGAVALWVSCVLYRFTPESAVFAAKK